MEDDPFAYFGEPTQAGTSEPTRPGIFLPGLEASRRREEGNKAPMQPPRVPVFGANDGVNMSKLFADKLAAQSEELRSKRPTLPPFQDLDEEGDINDTLREGYFSPQQSASKSHSDAIPITDKTQKVPSFSMSSSASASLLAGERFAEDASGALGSLLSAESEDVLHDKNESELRRANESEIRRAFVQSKTKVERRKGLRRILKVVLLLLAAVMVVFLIAWFWKYRVEGFRSFSWERVKSLWAMEAEGSLGSEEQAFYIAGGGAMGGAEEGQSMLTCEVATAKNLLRERAHFT